MSNSDTAITKKDFVSDTISYLTSKKGMYLVVGILLILAACYYKFTQKKEEKLPESNDVKGNENIHQPPPGYVTVPIELLQQLQNESIQNEQMQQQQMQQQQMQQQQMQQQQMPQQQGQQDRVPNTPQLRHNKEIEDDDSDIVGQNLSRQEMDSIQSQLNALQSKN